MLCSYVELFPYEGSDDEAEDDEFGDAQCTWVADFVLAFLRCSESKKDQFLESWGEALLCGSFGSLLLNLSDMTAAEDIDDYMRQGAEELLEQLIDVVQPMWDAAHSK